MSRLDYIAALEKAIEKKFGAEAIRHPKEGWSEEKEKAHLEQARVFYKRYDSILSQQKEAIEIDDFVFVSKHFIERETQRQCNCCNKYSFQIRDDVYMLKFDCCFECYVRYVKDREERWNEGWRPSKP